MDSGLWMGTILYIKQGLGYDQRKGENSFPPARVPAGAFRAPASPPFREGGREVELLSRHLANLNFCFEAWWCLVKHTT